jgi:hypothetical protein
MRDGRTIDPELAATMRRLHLAAASVAAAILALACSETQGPSQTPIHPGAFIVSSPVQALEPAVTVRSAGATFEPTVVYVSLPPGSIPKGFTATIRDLRTGSSVTAQVVNGGFDPVALPAVEGDTIAIAVQTTAATSPLSFRVIASASKRPAVVRTNPPAHKRDVTLNSIVVIVFSEPLDSTTVDAGSVQLWRGTTQVAGTVRFADATHLRAEFHPDSLLAPQTDYQLLVTTAIRDLNGLALDSAVTVPFTTGTAVAPATLHITITTTGAALDPDGYSLCVNVNSGGNPRCGYEAPVGVNAEVTLPVSAGNTVVDLDGVARNCTRTDGYVGIIPSGVTELAIAVTCGPPGSIRVTTTSTGIDIPGGYSVCVNTTWDYCFWGSSIGTNQVVTVDSVIAGPQKVTLYVAENCSVRGNSARTVTVPEDATLDLAFDVTCTLAERIAFTSGGVLIVRTVSWLSQAVTNGRAPAWSADGTRLAYECDLDICTINADGSDPRRLTQDQADNRHPSWSPDGLRIAFGATHAGMTQLHVMASDGSAVAVLTQAIGFTGSPAWSPDGLRIVYDCQVDAGNDDLCVVNPDGSGFARLTSDPARDYGAAWKPDGSTLAFATARYGEDEIALMSSAGGGVSRMGAGVLGFSPAWASDGNRLAFVQDDPGSYGHSNPGIVVGGADGSYLQGFSFGDQPAWKPHP